MNNTPLVDDAETVAVVLSIHVVLCMIWYHLYNLKNVKNTHGGVLLLAKLQGNSLQLY